MKRVVIVIQENGKQNGKGYDVFLEGDIERLKTTPDDELTPAEFWGKKLFQICVDTLKKVGAVHSIKVKQ